MDKNKDLTSSDWHAISEKRMDNDFVNDIINKEKYTPVEKGGCFLNIYDSDFLRKKFSATYDLAYFNEEIDFSKRHFITGFGPTNAPTGGTLSVILRSIFFARETGIDSTIIISNLGAFNSRNIKLEKIDYLTRRFLKFIKLLGFTGEIRTHSNFKLLVAAGLVSKVMTVNDFLENEEVTAELYKKLGVQGKDFSTFVDANYTVADILLPIILNRKERVMVFSGIEEHYFPKLANLAISRFVAGFPGQFCSEKAHVSAAFGNLINGLNGYPKMSKSIPESSINLDDTNDIIKDKILHCLDSDENIILQMINLVSDWDCLKINRAEEAFKEGGGKWLEYKKEYLEYFLSIKDKWEQTKNNYEYSIDNIFFNYE